MSFPYWTPNHAKCPECEGDATDTEHPENGFTCECGHYFEAES